MSQKQWLTRTGDLNLGRKTLKASLVSLVASGNVWAKSFSVLLSSLVITLFEADFLLTAELHLRAVGFDIFFLFFVYIYLLYQNILLFNLLFFERVLSFIQKNPFFTDTSSKANNSGAAIARFWAKQLLLNPVPLVFWTSLFFSRCYQCPSIVSGQLRDTFGTLLPQMSLCHHPSAIPYQEQFAAISLFP